MSDQRRDLAGRFVGGEADPLRDAINAAAEPEPFVPSAEFIESLYPPRPQRRKAPKVPNGVRPAGPANDWLREVIESGDTWR